MPGQMRVRRVYIFRNWLRLRRAAGSPGKAHPNYSRLRDNRAGPAARAADTRRLARYRRSERKPCPDCRFLPDRPEKPAPPVRALRGHRSIVSAGGTRCPDYPTTTGDWDSVATPGESMRPNLRHDFLAWRERQGYSMHRAAYPDKRAAISRIVQTFRAPQHSCSDSDRRFRFRREPLRWMRPGPVPAERRLPPDPDTRAEKIARRRKDSCGRRQGRWSRWEMAEPALSARRRFAGSCGSLAPHAPMKLNLDRL